MLRVLRLIQELCPNGVEYFEIKDCFTRLKGTPITAAKMKEIESPDGEIRIFAGGKTVINAYEKDIPNANITRVPAVLVQSRGVIDFIYYDKPFTFKNEMWAYTAENTISVKYLYYVLQNNTKYFRESASGMGSLPQISLHVTEKFKIPLPPIEIQREIVRILDEYSTSVTALQQELEKELTARKKQYEYYRDMLLDFGVRSQAINVERERERERKRLNCWRRDCEWRTIRLGDIGKISMCKRIMKSETSFDGDIPFYKIGTFGGVPNAYISKETFEKYKSLYSFPKKGDILISAAGTIGRTVVYDGEPAYFQDSNIVWIDNDETKVLNRYLYYLYQLSPWQISVGGTIARLYNDNIANTKINIPPISEQQRIVAILDRFDKLCNDITEGLPAEIEARRKQYEYYRDKLLSFNA